MNVLSLFTGIGGIDLGCERAGMHVIGQCEIERYCQRVLQKHWPDAPLYADVQDLCTEQQGRSQVSGRREGGGGFGGATGDQAADVSLLCGGFPCQDVSIAGRRAGLAGKRTGLFWEFCRIARSVRPEWILLENVPGLLTSPGRDSESGVERYGADFAVIIEALADIGYVLAWRVLDSRYFGVPQRRRRVFIVGRFGRDGSKSVLFESESSQGDSAASGEAGAQVAVPLTSGSHGVGVNRPGRRKEDDYNIVASALDQRKGGTDDNEAQANHIVAGPVLNQSSGGRGHRIDAEGAANNHIVAGTLGAGRKGGGRTTDLDNHGAYVTGFHLTQDPIDNGDATPALSKGNQKGCATIGVARSLNAKRGHRLDGDSDTFVGEQQIVRRLTPTECERLQGFPDGFTCMCGCDPYNIFDCKCPDSPRYAALGNAVTVNVAEWIAKRIVAVTEGVIA